MGLIEVSPTTSPERAAAIRARLMGRPQVSNILVFPPNPASKAAAPVRLPDFDNPKAWQAMTVDQKCGLIRKHWRENMTSREVAAAISRDISDHVPRCGILGLFKRHRHSKLSGMRLNVRTRKAKVSDYDLSPAKAKKVVLSEQEAAEKRNILSDVLANNGASFDAVLSAIAEWQGYSAEVFRGPCFEDPIKLARWKAYWIFRRVVGDSLESIAENMGGKHHSTVYRGAAKIDAMIAANHPKVADLKGWLND